MKSIIQENKECYLCRLLYEVENTRNLEEHHVIPGTANRRKSEQYGLKVWLCSRHHRTGDDAVHRNVKTMRWLKEIAQYKFEKTHTRKEWRESFGKSYIY